MRYIPEQKNLKLVNAIIAGLLVFGAVAYAIPIVCDAQGVKAAFPWVFTLLTLVSVVGAVFFLIRYRMTGFTYIITTRSGADQAIMQDGSQAVFAAEADVSGVRPEWLDLVVTKSQGNKPGITESVLSLGDLAAVYKVSRRKADGKLTQKDVRDKYRKNDPTGFVFYDYTLTYRLEEALELVFIDGSRYVGIILEVDGEMEQYLRGLVSADR